MTFRTSLPLMSLRATSRFVLRGVREARTAQRALFDDVIRPDRVAGPEDLPRVPLCWRHALGGWRLDGTVLPDVPGGGARHGAGSACGRPW